MYMSVPADCVVFFLVILAFVLFLKGCPDILCMRNNYNLPTLARFTQLCPACLAGKVALYTMAVLFNVRTHLSLRKLKPNNKKKNYAI